MTGADCKMPLGDHNPVDPHAPRLNQLACTTTAFAEAGDKKPLVEATAGRLLTQGRLTEPSATGLSGHNRSASRGLTQRRAQFGELSEGVVRIQRRLFTLLRRSVGSLFLSRLRWVRARLGR